MNLKTFRVHYTKHQLNLDSSKIYTTSGVHDVGAIDMLNAAMTFGQQFSDYLAYEIYIKYIEQV